MNALPDLSLHDLPDLTAWGVIPLISIEQAALLWGGIDPAFTCDTREAKRCHPEQYQAAMIAKQAFLGGIVMKTLEAYELYLCDFNNSYRADQRQESFTFEDIDTRRTIVQTDVLIEWAGRRNVLTIKQQLIRQAEMKRKKEFNDWIEQEAKPTEKPVIEYRLLEPRYPTPEFEAACEVVRDRWNKQEEGVKPPKQLEMREFIRKILKEKTGVEPCETEIRRVDTLARPLQFKNQQPTKKRLPPKT